MALKAVVDTLDGLDEHFKSHYVEKDGKFVLDVDPVEGVALEDVGGLKSALGRERTERERLERTVAKFKDLDPDKARQALERLAELEAIDPEKEADKLANSKFEAAKAQLLERHGSELASRDERIQHLTRTVESLLIDQVATAALAEAKGSVELLLPHVRAKTRVREVDGKFSVEVVDEQGNVRIADAKGTPMDIRGLIAEMKASEAFGRAFEASGNSGGGKPPGSSGGSGSKLKRSEMTAKQKAEYIAEHGQAAYLKLPK